MVEIDKLIKNVIGSAEVSLIGSVDENGFPYMKAMLLPRKREGIKCFYFTTNTSSMRVNQYKKNQKASVYFSNNQIFQGVMLKGMMEVLEDNTSKEMIWLPGDTMYYPLGVTDPDYCVLKFTAHEGRFYSNFQSHSFCL